MPYSPLWRPYASGRNYFTHIQAYHRNIRYPTHLLLTYQWYSSNWWLVEDQNYTCTGEQRGEVLHMTLSVNIFSESLLDRSFTNTTMNIVSGVQSVGYVP